MQEATFVHIIRQPALLATLSVEDVGNWVEQYPHIAILRVMLAFKAEQSHHDQAAFFLEQAASHVPDRRRLKRLMADWRAQMEVSSAEDDRAVEKVPAAADEMMATLAAFQEHKKLRDVVGEMPDETVKDTTNAIEQGEVIIPDAPAEVLTELHVDEETVEAVEPPTEVEVPTIVTSGEQEVAIDSDKQGGAVFTETEHEDLRIEAEVEVMEVEVAQAEELPDVEGRGTLQSTAADVEQDNAILPAESPIQDQQEEGITEEYDEDFLKAIGKWTADPAIAVPFRDEWILAAPEESLPEISLSDRLDTGLASSEIAWLMPFVGDFDLPVPTMISARKAKAAVVEISEPSVQVLEPLKEEEVSVVIEEDVPNEDPTLSLPITSDIKDVQAESIESTPAPAFSSTHSFDEWLQILSKQKEAGGEEPAFEMPQPDYIGAGEVDDRDKPEAKELIDVPESDVKRWAQESVTMQKDMASETLAKIYLQQGKLTLAIQIYKKLMERFPEKSTYFAAQIKSIKQE
jgi:hypothetical protein